MKVSLSWLREFAPDISGSPNELSETLSGLGLTVEAMTVVGEIVAGVVVAKVVNLRPHGGADRIQLVDLDCGDGELRQVCCGAFNMAVGDLVPLATPGTVMPNGLKIAERKMRGELSQGMCCSAAELGVSDDHENILILNDRLVASAKLGAPLGQALDHEVDVWWDLEVNANRPDAMSVAGIARDLSAALDVSFCNNSIEISITNNAELVEDLITVEIQDPSVCGRFLATVLRNVKVGSSPTWLADRLVAAGMRPVNSIVDISNYVMLELGQPSHTFDLATINGATLGVRRAREGETLLTLDGVARQLHTSDAVICNGADEVISLAGVMGGASTEISAATTDVLLEVAWWDPPTISRTVKRLNLASEASTRFRRGADWGDNMERALHRFVQLATQLGAVAVTGHLDVAGDIPQRTPVKVRRDKINGLLGTNLSSAAIAGHLNSIGFQTQQDVHPHQVAPDGEELWVNIPTWRWDATTETDIAEEVARLHGYENIAKTVRRGQLPGGLNEYQLQRRQIRQSLVGYGCDETMPMPFLEPQDLANAQITVNALKLSNPVVAAQSLLRPSLLPGQLKAIAYNQSHRNYELSFFEVGHVFLPPRDQLLPDEREFLGVALAGQEAPQAVEVLDLLETTLALPNVVLRPSEPPGMHATRSAEVLVAGKVAGVVGEVDPVVLANFSVAGRVGWLELDLGVLLDAPRRNRKYRAVSKLPSSDVDLAFEVPDSVSAAAIEMTLQKAGAPLLVQLALFDVYRGEPLPQGVRSLAFRLRFQAHDRTLTDAEVANARQACIDEVLKRHSIKLRS